MSLGKWAEYGWLKAEPTSRDEIKSLLTIVNRDLKDANVAAVSEDRRFEAAFNAARTAASVALRACGYRTSTQAGHHVKTIESLELTIHADPKLIQKMKTLSKKRNATSYDSAGNVSKQELELAIKTAGELQREVLVWLEKNYPGLLSSPK
jgi:phosphoenolpyruvate-protein kinase (PTS system EI component)